MNFNSPPGLLLFFFASFDLTEVQQEESANLLSLPVSVFIAGLAGEGGQAGTKKEKKTNNNNKE